MDSFLRELAYFYVPTSVTNSDIPPEEAGDSDSLQAKKTQNETSERWQIQHVLFPAIRRYLCPPKSLLTQDFIEVANVPELYRVFERC